MPDPVQTHRDKARSVFLSLVRSGQPITRAARDRLWALVEPDADFDEQVRRAAAARDADLARYKRGMEDMRSFLTAASGQPRPPDPQ